MSTILGQGARENRGSGEVNSGNSGAALAPAFDRGLLYNAAFVGSGPSENVTLSFGGEGPAHAARNKAVLGAESPNSENSDSAPLLAASTFNRSRSIERNGRV